MKRYVYSIILTIPILDFFLSKIIVLAALQQEDKYYISGEGGGVYLTLYGPNSFFRCFSGHNLR